MRSYCVRSSELSHLRVLAQAASVFAECQFCARMWPSPHSSGSDLSQLGTFMGMLRPAPNISPIQPYHSSPVALIDSVPLDLIPKRPFADFQYPCRCGLVIVALR